MSRSSTNIAAASSGMNTIVPRCTTSHGVTLSEMTASPGGGERQGPANHDLLDERGSAAAPGASAMLWSGVHAGRGGGVGRAVPGLGGAGEQDGGGEAGERERGEDDHRDDVGRVARREVGHED